MSLVHVTGATVRFGGVPLFTGASFVVAPGDRWGIVGRNGSGKTTLMELVTGVRPPDEGSVSRASGLRIALMDQYRDLGDARTVWDAAARGFADLFDLEIDLQRQLEVISTADERDTAALLDRYSHDLERFEHAGGYSASARVDAVLAGLGFDPEEARTRPVTALSGGERGRLALAGQLAAPADLLILDEPTNHLDLETAAWLESYLATTEEAVMVISHDRAFLATVADHILHFEGGTVEAYTGGYAVFVAQRAERRMALDRAVRKQDQKIAAEEDYIRRNIAGGNSSQAKGRRRRLSRVPRLSPPPEAGGTMAVTFTAASRGGDQVLVADKVTVAMGGQTLVRQWSGILRRGDVLGLIGSNGAGKSTLLRVLLGEQEPVSGTVRLMPSVAVAYYRQDLSNVNPAESLYDLVAHRRAVWTRGQVQAHLGRFGFSGDSVLRRAGSLSGGERARVALALMMLEEANLLVFDEPTNHLDVESIEALEDALEAYEGTVLLVSHDRALLDSLCTRIWAIRDGQLEDYPGGFLDWQADVAARMKQPVAVAAPKSEPKAKRVSPPSEMSRRRSNERAVAEAEAAVHEAETALAALEQQLADAALYQTTAGAEQARGMVARRNEIKVRLADALKHWEQLASS